MLNALVRVASQNALSLTRNLSYIKYGRLMLSETAGVKKASCSSH